MQCVKILVELHRME